MGEALPSSHKPPRPAFCYRGRGAGQKEGTLQTGTHRQTHLLPRRLTDLRLGDTSLGLTLPH